MDLTFKELFLLKWQKYFCEAGLPIVYYYADEVSGEEIGESKDEHRCLICNLNRVREGHTFVYSADSNGCMGGKRYSGFSQGLRPDFEYFLSCGIPGKLEGERYKKSPDLVKEFLRKNPPFKAPARYLVFKRWDKLSERDKPLAVIFFAGPDVLSGLFTLANFDMANQHGVITPMGSGCSSIISNTLNESDSKNPRCILGMFDVSARPCVPESTLTFSVPITRFEEMVNNMDESFLITQSWDLVKKRITSSNH
jgi:uncharacterized protein (DUF169 family)